MFGGPSGIAGVNACLPDNYSVQEEAPSPACEPDARLSSVELAPVVPQRESYWEGSVFTPAGHARQLDASLAATKIAIEDLRKALVQTR